MKEFDEIIKKLEADIEEYKRRNEMLSNEVNKHIKEGIEKDIENEKYFNSDMEIKQKLIDRINRQSEEIKRLKELCDKYEEEHKTTFEQWQEDIKRNKKAIEYIEEKGRLKYKPDELINILQGSDKE